MSNNPQFLNYLGLKFISCNFCADRKQVRFPRSKKKRIRLKWSKKDCNFTIIPWEKVIKIGDMFCGHPNLINKIIYDLESTGNAYYNVK